MSEYQYYEFLAIDRPLSDADQRWLRSLSTRADITSTSFVNTYHWGDFKGDPIKLMERCFDTFVYVSNFGYDRFMLRVPTDAIDLDTAKQYCTERSLSIIKKRSCTLIEFVWEGELDEWEDDGTGWMASLAPVRESLLEGDLRCLYLGWLAELQDVDSDDDHIEPPVPAGLRTRSAPLEALARFLRIDRRLIEIAAQTSPRAIDRTVAPKDVSKWLSAQPTAQKDDWLAGFMLDGEPALRRRLLQHIRKAAAPKASRAATHPVPRRRASELLEPWRDRVAEESRREAERIERERAKQAAIAARAREKYLANLAKQAAGTWQKIDSLVATRQPPKYREAADLLRDLREAMVQHGDEPAFTRRLGHLRERHAGKLNFLRLIDSEVSP